jgi:dCTP deaminase
MQRFGDSIGKPYTELTGVLPDWAIREFITIRDFVDYDECPKGKISYGLTSGGYDLRVGYKFKVFTNANCAIVDPKDFDPSAFLSKDLTPVRHNFVEEPEACMGEPESVDGFDGYCKACGRRINKDNAEPCESKSPVPSILIPPNSFALAETIEHLSIPNNVMCLCIGKSTYARVGINLNFTPFEPGWRGIVTVEIINGTPLPVRIHAGEGIGQALFFMMASPPDKSYGDKKNAKYQDQTGLTLPKVL